MAERYFEKFPIITYSNNSVVDITKRVALLERVSQNPYVFYPYDISDNERPDQLSTRYYDDPYKSWLVYIANKIIDPYYEWYLSNDEFNEFIEKKYGSIESAQQKITYYKNNWKGQEPISYSAFNVLSAGQKKYWEPMYGATAQILAYKRKEENWISNTNKIVNYTVSSTSNFTTNEICNIFFDTGMTGKGQVAGVFSNSTANYVSLHHLSGTYYTSDTVSITAGSYIYGNESGSNVSFTAVYSAANTIPEEETSYWTPVSYYDYEFDKNEYNKSVRVLDSSLSYTATQNLKDLMKV